MSRFQLLAAAACAVAAVSAQPSLNGVVDIHVHSDPDAVPRSIDAYDLAKLAKERGIRGLVLKSHYEPTATSAYLVRRAVPAALELRPWDERLLEAFALPSPAGCRVPL